MDSAQYCFTREETNFFIEQCFIVKEQDSSLYFKDKTINTLSLETSALRKTISENDKELEIRLKQNGFCQANKDYLSNQLRKAEFNKRLFKTGFMIVGGVAIVELFIIMVK